MKIGTIIAVGLAAWLQVTAAGAQVILPTLPVEGEQPPAFVPAPHTVEAIKNWVEGIHYWFAPAEFPGRVPVQGHPYGPKAARGLVIWSADHHEEKIAFLKVTPIAQYFAEQGWDVYNLRRHSILAGNEGMVQPWLPPRRDFKVVRLILAIVEEARAMGYQRVVLMGTGRGAIESIRAGRFRASVQGIIALAPALYNDHLSTMHWRRNHSSLLRLYNEFPPASIQLATAFFRNDEWYEGYQPNVRGPAAVETLTQMNVPHFVIDRPAYKGMDGHEAGLGWPFARRYGPCLELFVESGARPACDDRDPATAAVFGVATEPAPARQGDYVGVWQGTWDSGRFAVLAVSRLEGDIATAIYRPGRGVDGQPPDSRPWRLPLGGGALDDSDGAAYVFGPGPDGTLRGERRKGAETETILMHRMP